MTPRRIFPIAALLVVGVLMLAGCGNVGPVSYTPSHVKQVFAKNGITLQPQKVNPKALPAGAPKDAAYFISFPVKSIKLANGQKMNDLRHTIVVIVKDPKQAAAEKQALIRMIPMTKGYQSRIMTNGNVLALWTTLDPTAISQLQAKFKTSKGATPSERAYVSGLSSHPYTTAPLLNALNAL